MTADPHQIPYKIIECPRDAMQGIHDFIPTKVKADYINLLLKVGFDTIDFGSFVSPKSIPQLRDTAEVLAMLNLEGRSKLLAIVANKRGGEEAVLFNEISYLGFPFSVSETFQQRNTNSSREQSLDTTEHLMELCVKNNKKLVVYLSMAFGNPYGDEWNAEIVSEWAQKLRQQGVEILSLADTVGLAKPADISYLLENVKPEIGNAELGIHLHCRPDDWQQKVSAAFDGGCKRFDSAMKGYGGCPMAADTLTGNLATENLIQYLEMQNVPLSLNKNALYLAMAAASGVFETQSTVKESNKT
jgi:hydroxymethylglutaryl-CoA lyase